MKSHCDTWRETLESLWSLIYSIIHNELRHRLVDIFAKNYLHLQSHSQYMWSMKLSYFCHLGGGWGLVYNYRDSWLITLRAAAASLEMCRPRPKSNCLPSWANAPWFPTRAKYAHIIWYYIYICIYIHVLECVCVGCSFVLCLLFLDRCTKIQRVWDFVIVILKCFRIYFIFFLRRSRRTLKIFN